MEFLSLAEVSRRIGKPGNRKLVRFLIHRAGIPLTKSSNSLVIPADKLSCVESELSRWENRPRLSREPASVAG